MSTNPLNIATAISTRGAMPARVTICTNLSDYPEPRFEIEDPESSTPESISVEFSFDGLDILGVLHGYVFVRGDLWPQNDEPVVYPPGQSETSHTLGVGCVDLVDIHILMKPRLFKRALVLWLRDKKNICLAYRHLCGRMGSIRATVFRETQPCDDGGGNTVRQFIVTAIEDNTDMVHG